jgi:hypothetical protein
MESPAIILERRVPELGRCFCWSGSLRVWLVMAGGIGSAGTSLRIGVPVKVNIVKVNGVNLNKYG